MMIEKCNIVYSPSQCTEMADSDSVQDVGSDVTVSQSSHYLILHGL